MGWAGLGTLAPQLLQFLSMTFLARLLPPSDFGLFTLVTMVSGFALIFMSSGLGAFVVHTVNTSSRMLSTVFWINTFLAITVSALILALSGPIAHLFDEPALAPLVQISALGFLFGIGATHLGLLDRDLRFRTISTSLIIGTLVGQSLSILLAIAGLGPVALVTGTVASQAVQTILFMRSARWRPRLTIGRSEAATVWQYARHVLGFNALNYWSRNLDNFVIGLGGNSASLGLYARAYSLMLLPVNLIGSVVGQVSMPVTARLQHDLALASRTWTRYATLSLLVGLPISALLIVAPDLVLQVLFGPQWSGAAVFAQILAVGIAPQLVLRASGSLFQALGRTRAQLVVGLAQTSIMVAGVLLGYLLAGAEGVAVGVSCAFFAQFVPFAIYAAKWIGVQMSDFLGASAVLTLLATMAGVGAFGVRTLCEGLPVLAQLILVAATLAILYAAGTWLFGRRHLVSGWELVRGKIA